MADFNSQSRKKNKKGDKREASFCLDECNDVLLPTEALSLIVSKLSVRETGNFALVCRAFERVVAWRQFDEVLLYLHQSKIVFPLFQDVLMGVRVKNGDQHDEALTSMIEVAFDLYGACSHLGNAKKPSFYGFIKLMSLLRKFPERLRNHQELVSRFLDVALQLPDVQLLQFLLSTPYLLTISEMNRIAQKFPKELPSVVVNENKDLRIPIMATYVQVDERESIGTDLSSLAEFQNLRYVSFYHVFSDCLRQHLPSLKPSVLTELVSHGPDSSVVLPPVFFSLLEQAKTLKRLRICNRSLAKCPSVPISAIVSSICSCTDLVELDLSGSGNVEPVLGRLLGKMKSLQVLKVSDRDIEFIPSSISKLEQLRVISLENCSQLSILPLAARNHPHLRELRLKGTFGVSLLHSFLGDFVQLRVLSLTVDGEELPYSIRNLTNLKVLDIQVRSLESFPNWIEEVDRLEEIHVNGCGVSPMASIASNVFNLKALRVMRLFNFQSVESIPHALGNFCDLRELDLSLDSSLESIPFLQHCTRLRILNLRGCEKLKLLPSKLGVCEYLEKLELSGCASLQSLPQSMLSFKRLRSLKLGGCINLKSLPSRMDKLTSLQELNLEGCISLSLPPSIGCIPTLKVLNCNGLSSLKVLQLRVKSSVALVELNLDGWSMSSLPSWILGLEALRVMSVRKNNLTSLSSSVKSLQALERLDLSESFHYEFPLMVNSVRSFRSSVPTCQVEFSKGE